MSKKYFRKLLVSTKYAVVGLYCLLIHGDILGQVTVNGGGTATYSTLNAAFAAINAGTHTGTITVVITADLSETSTVPLQASGVGSASYGSIVISPSGNRIVTGQIFIPAANRGLIEFAGADNIIIDGDDPSTSGTRNLRIEVGITSSSATCAIRVGSINTATPNPCSNITIKNCILRGGRPSNSNLSQNCVIAIVSNNTSNLMGGGNNGIGNNRIYIENNEIYRAIFGVYSVGSTTASQAYSEIKISRNIIGTASVANDMIGGTGVHLVGSANGTAGTTATTVNGNEIIVGLTSASGMENTSVGINIDANNNAAVIRENYIHDIINNTLNNWAVAGIRIIGGSTGLLVFNNIIRDVISARKTTTLGANANYGVMVLGADRLIFNNNTVGLIVANSQGSTASALSCGFFLNTGSNLLEFNNNIIVNRNASLNAFAIGYLGTGWNSASSVKNCYHFPSGAFCNLSPNTLPNWQLVTSKDLSSFIENPKFVSNADLHIQSGFATKLESNTTNCPYIDDIDIQSRPGPTGSSNGGAMLPDIGADEFDGVIYLKPRITNVVLNPDTQSCNASSRLVVATVSTGNALDSVMIEYATNGGAKSFFRMSSSSAGVYSYNIPAAYPSNATISFRVFCVTASNINDTITSNYYYYNDNTASAAMLPNLVADPPLGCAGSTIDLSYNYGPDPTGVNFPPSVANAALLSDIIQVKFNNTDNTTALGSLSGTIGNASGTSGSYSNFRNVFIDTLSLGKSYPLSITSGSSSQSRDFFAAYVDFNGDGDFIDAGEEVFKTLSVDTIGSRKELGNIYIPPSVRPGKTTIRFIVSNRAIVNAFNPLLTGEVEDYTIYIRPNKLQWTFNSNNIGFGNPKTVTLVSPPDTATITLIDEAGCTFEGNNIIINPSSGSPVVTITGVSLACYNTPYLLTANVTGGCPPYTYTWTPSGPNAKSNPITVFEDSLTTYVVTVKDANNVVATDTHIVFSNNPQLLTLRNDTVCNRGEALLRSTGMSTDSTYWYNNLAASPYNILGQSRNYKTPTLNFTTLFFAAAFRSLPDVAGKPNTSGTSASVLSTNTGLRFSTSEPIIIRRCSMYMAGPATSRINIGLLDKYGSIIAETGLFTPTFAANATLPTIINLNFLVQNADVDYKLVLLDQVGLTTLTRNSAGYSFPIFPTRPMVITGSFNINNPSANEYFNFYNIEIQKSMCVGKKRPDTALVTPPLVPKIFTDLKFTQICKGARLTLPISVNSLGDKFVWIKDGAVIQDTTGGFPRDTSFRPSYVVDTSKPSDTGLYMVKIYSSSYCTRDTFTRTVRVAFYPETKFLTNLAPINMCIRRDAQLKVKTDIGLIYTWVRNGIDTIKTGYEDFYDLPAAAYADSGFYRVIVNDTNRCRDIYSSSVKVRVVDTPAITFDPIDSVVCEGIQLVIKAKAKNATEYQWYKDNGLMPFFIRDSITLYEAGILDSGLYKVKASSYPGCPDAYSKNAKLIVNPTPKVLGVYPDRKVCENNKIRINGLARNYASLQWFKNNTSLGIISDSVVINSAQLGDSGSYYFVALPLNKCPAAKSDSFKLRVFQKSSIILPTLSNLVMCTGTDTSRGFNTINGVIYQWYKDGVAMQDMTDSLFKIRFSAKKDEGVYTLGVTSDAVCPEVRSPAFRLNIQEAPTIDIAPYGDTLCKGTTATLFVSTLNSSTLQWRKNQVAIPGATGSSLQLTNINASNAGWYDVIVNGQSPCLSIKSDSVPIIVKGGATNATLSLVSVYDAVEQCTDQDDWTYYSPPTEPDKFIFAIHKNGNNMTGLADVVIRPNIFQNISNSTKGYNGTLLLKSFWNYKLAAGEITEPFDVKFYYNINETNNLDIKKDEIKALYKDDITFENENIRWFKTDSLPFSNSIINNIVGNNFGFKSTDLTDVELGAENSVNYIIFYGIKNIGGGTGAYTFKGGSRIIGSILDPNAQLSSSIFPNPSTGQFKLQLQSATRGQTEITIYNALGQLVHTEHKTISAGSSDVSINGDQLPSGMYRVLVTKGDHSATLVLQISK